MPHKFREKQWRVRWHEGGKQLSKLFDSFKEAEKFEAQTKLQLKFAPEKKTQKNVLFKEFAVEYYNKYSVLRKGGSSLVEDKSIIEIHLLPAWGEKRMRDLTDDDITDLASELKAAGRSPKRINNITDLAKNMMLYAKRKRHLDESPFKEYERVKVPKMPPVFWTKKERDRFLEFVKNEDQDMFELVTVAVYMGLRLGELKAMLCDQLDFEREFMMVSRAYCSKTKMSKDYPKGMVFRDLPMADEVVRVLRNRKNWAPTRPAFKPELFDFMLLKRFRRYCKAAEVKPIRWHDLRHSCASQMVNAGASIYLVSKFLGHKDISQTMNYSHLAPDHLGPLKNILSSARVPQTVPHGEKSKVVELRG